MITTAYVEKKDTFKLDTGYFHGVKYLKKELKKGIHQLTIYDQKLNRKEKKRLKKLLPKYTVNVLDIKLFRDAFKTFMLINSHCFKFLFLEAVNSNSELQQLIKTRILKSPSIDITLDTYNDIESADIKHNKHEFLEYLRKIKFIEFIVRVQLQPESNAEMDLFIYFLKRTSITSLYLNHGGPRRKIFLPKIGHFLSPPILYTLSKLVLYQNFLSLSKKQWLMITGNWFKGSISIKTGKGILLIEEIETIVMLSFLTEELDITILFIGRDDNTVSVMKRDIAKYVLTLNKINRVNFEIVSRTLLKPIISNETKRKEFDAFLRSNYLLDQE